MVGDGINDAPAMKTGRCEYCNGDTIGSDIAIETVDIVSLMSDDLSKIPLY